MYDHCNVYRDRNWLVAPIHGAVFPNRCVNTNEPVNEPNYQYFTDLCFKHIQVPGGRLASFKIAVTVLGLRRGIRGGSKRLEYFIGLSNECQSLAIKRWRLGIALVVVGPLLSVVLGAGSAHITKDMFGKPSLSLAIVGCAIGMILMVMGAIFFAESARGILRVVRTDGKYVWFEGASPEFLATLPESPEKWTPR